MNEMKFIISNHQYRVQNLPNLFDQNQNQQLFLNIIISKKNGACRLDIE